MRNSSWRRTWTLSTTLVLSLVASDRAAAQQYLVSPVAFVTDPAPGTSGGAFSSIGRYVINAAGDVAFKADVSGGSVSEGIWLDSGGPDTAVVLAGDIAPGTGGGSYSSFVAIALNDAGDVAFKANVSGGSVSEGVFMRSGGVDTAVALPGTPAPGTGGGTYSGFPQFVATNNAGDVAFKATVSGGTVAEGIFLDSAGTQIVLALPGDPAPETVGQTFAAPTAFAVSAAGEVSTVATLAPSGEEGVFVVSESGGRAVALEGDPAPGTGAGSTFTFFSSSTWISPAGLVVFIGRSTGSPSSGVFRDANGAVTVAAIQGDTAPGAGGATYTGLTGLPSINDCGHVVFTAELSGGTSAQGVFVDSIGIDLAIALEGQIAPATAGGTYSTVDSSLSSINAAGDIAFIADISGGIFPSGLFKAAAPPNPTCVPALSPVSAMLMSVVMGLAGWRRLSA